MNVVTEFVKFDDEDRGNIDYEGGEYPYGIHRAEKDHMFFLCYYTPQNQDNIVVPGEGNSKRFKFSSLRILILRLCLASPRRSSQNKLTNLIQRHLRNWRLTWRWKPIAAGGGAGKPGSHMPRDLPTTLRQDSDMSADAAYNTVPIWEHKSPGNRGHSRSWPPTCLQNWHKFDFAGMPEVKTSDVSWAVGVMFSYVGVVPQAAPAVTLQVHRGHMRTRN